MKRFLSVAAFLVLLLCLVLFPVCASSPEERGALGDDVTYVLDLFSGTVTVSGSGPMWDFDHTPRDTAEGDSKGRHSPLAFSDAIRAVVIEPGVTTVGQEVMCGCRALEQVILPDSIEKIGLMAFASCSSLEAVYFLGDAPEMDGAFDGNQRLYHLPEAQGWSGVEKAATFCGAPFSDVSPNAWYAQSVRYAWEQELFSGMELNRFAPESGMTRGMLTTLLYRMAGQPETGAACPFGDVAQGRYYTKAITWAASAGVVRGITETAFAPEQPVTREQLAAILFRYASYTGCDTGAQGSLSSFPDAGQVSPYAQKAMTWAVGSGILKGIQNEAAITLSPKQGATRAQVAAILMRFLEQSETSDVGMGLSQNSF